jgi:hypothetical protein
MSVRRPHGLRSAWAASAACAAALATAAGLLGGCGHSDHHAAHVSAATGTQGRAKSPADVNTTRRPHHSSKRQSAAPPQAAPGVPEAPTTPRSQIPQTAGAGPFAARVGMQCRLASAGLPGASPRSGSQPSAPAVSSAGVYASRYVLARRLIALLAHAHPPSALRAAVGALLREMRRLEALYLVGAHAGGALARRAILVGEARARHIATIVGVPACAPGTSSPQPGQSTLPVGPGAARAPMPPR